MNFILKLIISAIAVLLTSMFLDGVQIHDNDFKTAFLVAIVLAFLNSVVKPILILFTIPVTFFTLGLFLIVINACIVLMAHRLVDGFHVDGWWSAIVFSIINSLVVAIFESMTIKKEPQTEK